MKSYTIGEKGYAAVITQDGTIVYHPDKTRILKDKLKYKNGSLAGIEQDIATGKSGIKEYNLDGVVKYVAYSPIMSNGWSVSAVVSKAETQREIITLNRLIFCIFSLAIIMMVVILFITITKSIKPLSLATSHIIDLTKGEFDKDFPEKYVKQTDEVGQLAKAIVLITVSLREREKAISEIKRIEEQILQLNAELEQKVADRTIQLEEVNAGLEEEIEERGKLERELILARETAETANNYKSEFLANMSHEIRTPINAIIGFNHLLSNTSVTAQQKEYIYRSRIAAQSLLGIIDDILDISKIEANKIELDTTPFSLAELFDNIESMFRTRAVEKGLELIITVDSKIPNVLIGDPIRLTQVIMNLLSNALKFTQKGKVHVAADLYKKDEDKVTLRFKFIDTGIGISSEQLGKLFNPFTQADTSVTRKYGGTGLGLSISKRLIKLMGGFIYAESVINKGSTFTVFADFEYSQDSSLLKAAHQYQFDKTSVQNKKILLVEDNEMNQFVIGELLHGVGMRVEMAENGAEAVNRIEAGNRFDLILMDVHMPVLNGYDAAKKIRDFDSKTPIIAITADAIKEVNQKVIEAGMNAYISKPIDPDRLFIAIQDIFRTSSPLPPSLSMNSLTSDIQKSHADNFPQQLPGINLKEALLRINGKKDKYLQMLRIFKDHHLTCLPDLKAALSKREISAAIRLIHTLKGNSASIGANDVSKISEKIQSLLEDKLFGPALESLLSELEIKLSIVKQSISELEQYFAELSNMKQTYRTRNIVKEIKVLKCKIKNKEFDAHLLFENIQEEFLKVAGKNRAESMHTLLLSFQWKKAEEVLDEIINELNFEEC